MTELIPKALRVLVCIEDEGTPNDILQKLQIAPYYAYVSAKMLKLEGLLDIKKEGKKVKYVLTDKGKKVREKLIELLNVLEGDGNVEEKNVEENGENKDSDGN